MTFSKRMKVSLLAGLIATILGSLLVLLLTESVRSIALATLIISAVIFGITLILSFVLEGKSSKIRIPVFAAVVFISLMVVFCFTIYNLGKRITMPGSYDEDAYEELCDMKAGVVEISYESLSGWRIPASSVAEGEQRPVILYFGGNGENSSFKVLYILENDKLSFLHENYDFVYIDYPTYGLSEGTLSERSVYEYTLQAYAYVTSLETTSSVTLLSYSIGNGPAMYLASQDDVDISSMVMLAPYSSGYDLYNSSLNIFHGPFRLLVAYRYTADRYASDVDCPVTMIVSTTDEVIPTESSRALFSALSSTSANYITVEDVGHNVFFQSPEVIMAIMSALGVN